MRSTPFGSANFHLNSTLSGSINSALTLTRMLTASRTINGHTANFSATNSFTFTAAQIAAAIVAQRIRHRERAILRRDVIASAYSGYGFPASAYPSMLPYSAAGYGGGGYSSGGFGYPSGGGMGYGGGAAPAEQQAAAPGVQVAGNEENRPEPDEQAVNRLLAAAGVSDPEGNLLWPVGLRALPADRDGRLRGRIDALLGQEKDEAASGTVTADLQRDLASAVDALRKQLLRDREERFSLTHRAYEDAEDYLAKLKQVSKQLVKAGEAATRELRGGKPGANATPQAAQGEVKQVGLYDDRFDPPQLTVPVGTTIRWTNHGQHMHTVTSDKRDWGSKELGPSAVYTYTFTRPGTYAYHCEKHPGQMRGTVIVK